MDVLEAQVQYELAVTNEIARKNEVLASIINIQKITRVDVQEVTAISLEDILNKRIDKSLDEWINSANTSNSDILLAKMNVELYQQNLNVAKSKYFPKLSLVGRISDTDSLDTTIGGQDMRVIFRITSPIFSGGRISSGVEEAQRRLESQKEIENDVRRKVELQIIDTYNKWEALKKQVDAYKNALVSASLYLNATEEAYSLRLKALTDLLEARSKYYKIKRDLINLSYNEYLHYLKLKILSGEPLEF